MYIYEYAVIYIFIWPEKMEGVRIAALYKKGDMEKPENYRPLSLLNTLFKTLAAIMKARIEEEVEDQLGETQFGFRAKKGTNQAIYVARRVQRFAERAGTQGRMIFLDWEKAFDKISHDWLIEALKSYGLPPKMVGMIRKVYENPRFYVEVDGVKSTWKNKRKESGKGALFRPIFSSW